jgi:hypothetical protein
VAAAGAAVAFAVGVASTAVAGASAAGLTAVVPRPASTKTP